MRVDENDGSNPNYLPKSFDAMEIDLAYKEPPMEICSDFADQYYGNCEGENDHYTQRGNLFKIMTPD